MSDNRSVTCPKCGGWMEIDDDELAHCDTCDYIKGAFERVAEADDRIVAKLWAVKPPPPREPSFGARRLP